MKFSQEVRSATDFNLEACNPDESRIAADHSEWFSTLVEEQMTRLDEIAQQVTEADRNRMKEHFIISSQYEYSFWEMAYQLEAWPIDTRLRCEQK